MSTPKPNYWFDDRCAKAFWDQKHAVPYQELLRDTVAQVDPQPGERWLDLGCGGGQLSAGLWQKSQGQLAEVVAMDCAAVNVEAITKLAAGLKPMPESGQVRFQQGDLSQGLPQFADGTLNGIISGLAISYAEHWDEATGKWTDQAFTHLLTDLYRVLAPGGRLVFSINVPEPDFWKILWRSFIKGLRMAHIKRVLKNALRMQKYGKWLKQEARVGRFHYYSQEELRRRLEAVGFRDVSCTLSYANQAYIFRAVRPAAVAIAA